VANNNLKLIPQPEKISRKDNPNGIINQKPCEIETMPQWNIKRWSIP